MTDSLNKIVVDASFLQGVDDSKDIAVKLLFPDFTYLGYNNYFVDVNFETPSLAFKDNRVTFETTAVSSGTNGIVVDLTNQTSISSSVDRLVNFYRNIETSGTVDNQVSAVFKVGYSSAELYVPITFIGGRPFERKYYIPVELVVLNTSSGLVSTEVAYANYTGFNDYYYNPLPTWSGTIDEYVEYFTGSGTIVQLDRLVEVHFAGWIPHNTRADVYCSVSGVKYFNYDVVLTSGSKYGVGVDCHAAYLKQDSFSFDSFCSLEERINWYLDTALISGSKYGITTDSYSSYQIFDGNFNADIRLFPIYFDNFTLNIGEFAAVSGTICVDAHDGFYNLLASGTYFKINDVQVSGTLEPLSDGFRICYNPDDDFTSLSGITKFTAHAENDHGDILEENYYLTFGYIVEFDNKERIGLNYGFNNKVTVRIEAENFGSCPTLTTKGYWFVSEEHLFRNLSAFIIAEGGIQRANTNLGAAIYPHSTAYFYDKEFRVVITAKDFNGNAMEPYILEFKIRNDG